VTHGYLRWRFGTSWSSHEDAMSYFPYASWMELTSRGDEGGLFTHRLHDSQTALEGIGIGLLKSFLPTLSM
jgi:hypothetical protein